MQDHIDKLIEDAHYIYPKTSIYEVLDADRDTAIPQAVCILWSAGYGKDGAVFCHFGRNQGVGVSAGLCWLKTRSGLPLTGNSYAWGV